MAASEVTVNAYILYAFMGVIVLLLVALLGAVFRMLYVMGGLQVEIAALWRAMGEVKQEIADLREQVSQLREQVSQLREQVSQLRERVAENRSLILDINRRIDLMMRHRHDPDTGNVVLTPSAPEPERVAD